MWAMILLPPSLLQDMLLGRQPTPLRAITAAQAVLSPKMGAWLSAPAQVRTSICSVYMQGGLPAGPCLVVHRGTEMTQACAWQHKLPGGGLTRWAPTSVGLGRDPRKGGTDECAGATTDVQGAACGSAWVAWAGCAQTGGAGCLITAEP